MKVARFVGVSEEDRWSYDIAKFSKQPEYNALKSARQYHINAYYRCNSVNSICGSLNSGYTVVGGFSVPEEMYSDEVTASGIIPIPGPDSKFVGGHAVHFVGYDHTRRMLLFQNSWGKDWGEEGFGWLPYAYVDGGFAGDFWTIRDE
jgi:C1A family cysteine protease